MAKHPADCICINCISASNAAAQRDAARYRWLRDSSGNDIMRKLMREPRSDGWDALIDRDMHRSNRQVPPEHEFDQNGKCKWCPSTVGGDHGN